MGFKIMTMSVLGGTRDPDPMFCQTENDVADWFEKARKDHAFELLQSGDEAVMLGPGKVRRPIWVEADDGKRLPLEKCL